MRPKKQVGSLFLVIEKFLANFSSKIILPNNSWTEYKIANECPEFFTYFIRLYNFDLFVGPKIQWIIYLGLRMRVWDCMRLCIFIIAYGSLEERKFRFWLFEILFVDGVGFYLMALANHKTYNISRVGYRERETHTHMHTSNVKDIWTVYQSKLDRHTSKSSFEGVVLSSLISTYL